MSERDTRDGFSGAELNEMRAQIRAGTPAEDAVRGVSGVSNIERTEKRITGLIDVAPHPGGDFYRDILEVLLGRREQVEALRQQLEGAVEALTEVARRGYSQRLASEWIALPAIEALKTMGVDLSSYGGRER